MGSVVVIAVRRGVDEGLELDAGGQVRAACRLKKVDRTTAAGRDDPHGTRSFDAIRGLAGEQHGVRV